MIIRKGQIEQPREILIILTDEERKEQLSIPFTREDHNKWWFAKLKSMGAWVTRVISVIQQKENDKWSNSFIVVYK